MQMGRLTWACAGMVVDEADQPGYIGARAHTNNTGELSGLWYALERAERRAPGRGREVIHTDSLYALNMTTGKWMPRTKGRRNAAMVADMRRKWRRVQRLRPGEVALQHVRSHIKVPGNELADWLADQGAAGATMTLERATMWMSGWMRKQHPDGACEDSARPPGRPPGRPALAPIPHPNTL